jgi:hypothetical protein
MELGKEDAFMTSFFDDGLEHRDLIREIILFTEQHAKCGSTRVNPRFSSVCWPFIKLLYRRCVLSALLPTSGPFL